MTEPVRVLGLGNVLMTDDGFGPWVVEHLKAHFEFPASVEVVDLGTPGLDLVPYLADADTVVVIDTVKSTGAPGELRRYRLDQILANPPQPRLSPHDPGLKDTLLTLTLAGRAPREVIVVGAIPARVAMGNALTPVLQAAVAPAARIVVDELVALGIEPSPKDEAGPVGPWWTREVPAAGAS